MRSTSDGGNYGDEHFKQLCAEQLVTHVNRRTRRARTEWQQLRPRDEVLDCRVYARAAAWDLGMDRMQEKHWTTLETQLGAAPVKPKQEPPSPAGELTREQPPPPARRPPPRPSPFLGERTRGWLDRRR